MIRNYDRYINNLIDFEEVYNIGKHLKNIQKFHENFIVTKIYAEVSLKANVIELTKSHNYDENKKLAIYSKELYNKLG